MVAPNLRVCDRAGDVVDPRGDDAGDLSVPLRVESRAVVFAANERIWLMKTQRYDFAANTRKVLTHTRFGQRRHVNTTKNNRI